MATLAVADGTPGARDSAVAVPGDQPSARWQSDLVAGTYVSNWWPHIDSAHTLGYLPHTWALAVEEQFYLVWPLILAVVLRRRLNAWWLLAPMVALVALRVEVAGMPGRVDGLIIGALVALVIRDGSARWASWRPAAWLGTTVILAGMLLDSMAHNHGRGLDVAITAVELGVALLLANLAVVPASCADWLLSTRPLVEIGKLSYTIYLVHYPIFVWVDSRRLGRVETLAFELLLTVPAVVACWLFVEKPARRMKARWSTVAATDAVAAER